ncbi:hypothetical protein CEXT_728631, partial [Caerostris extrusa]
MQEPITSQVRNYAFIEAILIQIRLLSPRAPAFRLSSPGG